MIDLIAGDQDHVVIDRITHDGAIVFAAHALHIANRQRMKAAS
jgi:hypothetical protein